MRIIGNLDFPGIKATIFKMEDRLSIKFETGLYEQTFKFRSGEGIESVEEVRTLLSPAFLHGIQQGFNQMHQIRVLAVENTRSSGENLPLFEEII